MAQETPKPIMTHMGGERGGQADGQQVDDPGEHCAHDDADDTADGAEGTASVVNWVRMVCLVAPMALRTPISRVRSVTETSMMFMTPTPPTIRPTLETAIMKMTRPPVSWPQSLVSESGPKISKLSSASTLTLRRMRSISRISSSTSALFLGSSYFTLTHISLSSGCRLWKVPSGK
jgi:hypothetical protein